MQTHKQIFLVLCDRETVITISQLLTQLPGLFLSPGPSQLRSDLSKWRPLLVSWWILCDRFATTKRAVTRQFISVMTYQEVKFSLLLEGRHLYFSVGVIVKLFSQKRNEFSSKHTFETSQPRVLSLSFEVTYE